MTAFAWCGALSRALAPPAGSAVAFLDLGLEAPAPAAVALEHQALFGRAGPALVSPYEAVQRGTAPHDVAAEYAAAGYALDPSFRDRSDHVSAELALLDALRARRRAAVVRGDREARRSARDAVRAFFLRRIRPWVPGFLEALAAAEGFSVHRGLALRASDLLREDARRFGGDDREREPAPLPPEPACGRCGAPLGFSPPRRPNAVLPDPDPVCVRCRVRDDLLRTRPRRRPCP